MIAEVAGLLAAVGLLARPRGTAGIPVLPLTPLVPPPTVPSERGTSGGGVSHAPEFCPDLGTRKTISAPFQDPVTREITYFGEYSGTVTGCFEDDGTPVVCVGGAGGLRCAHR